MSVKDELGKRIKENYENRSKTSLVRRMPVLIRIDGKCFHQFTKGFEKPFDHILITSMQETMKYLCENIQGCVLGYTQSDEITLVLQDYKELTTDAWFDYEVQKICSVAASMATLAFNQAFERNYLYHIADKCGELDKYDGMRDLARKKGAMFDARCFNVPKEEVVNCIYWRQLDCIRNSIQMVGQAYFSQKELWDKSCNQIQDMLQEQKGINWNDFPADCKRGSCCIKVLRYYNNKNEVIWPFDENENIEDITQRNVWIVDKEIPLFVNEGRNYIESRINFD